ncbi:MAG: phosphoribosyl-ATP diphosphatase [Gammaproteobacteria bacterium]|nr:phosphoribosyl-ATP diphosphatase [Gammaproteobacteria bacterium]
MSRDSLAFLLELEVLIAGRRAGAPPGSYTASLFEAGPVRIAQKVGEEGVELALAGATGEAPAVVSEAADLLYHVLVLLSARDIPLADVVNELRRRHR